MDESDYNAIFEPDPVSEIELLGYAKNYIAEVEQMIAKLPYEHWMMLYSAYHQLNEVQEYLFNN